mmetsp:Transcript_34096/g.55595  ORF Transcript_34096/g.55595 Transcript_34096/m.55595 type:complete len:88 (+) Transcript_34096:186-449(+)
MSSPFPFLIFMLYLLHTTVGIYYYYHTQHQQMNKSGGWMPAAVVELVALARQIYNGLNFGPNTTQILCSYASVDSFFFFGAIQHLKT